MTQKTLGVLWWSSYHLKWADHVFKVRKRLDMLSKIHICSPCYMATEGNSPRALSHGDLKVDSDTFVNFERLVQVCMIPYAGS